MTDEIAAVSTPAHWETALEHSQRAARRLLDTLARKVEDSRAVHYVKTHSAREVATELKHAAKRRPVYALAAAVAAGFLLGCVLKSSLRSRG
jgi:hypothetical protein